MLPEAFCIRMKRILGDEYAEFEKALTEGEAVRGARVNRIKLPGDGVPNGLPLSPVSYAKDGYVFHSDEAVGTHPAHHSGAI